MISIELATFVRYVVTVTSDCRSDVTELFSAGTWPTTGVWCESSDGAVNGRPELSTYVLIVNVEDKESRLRVEGLSEK